MSHVGNEYLVSVPLSDWCQVSIVLPLFVYSYQTWWKTTPLLPLKYYSSWCTPIR